MDEEQMVNAQDLHSEYLHIIIACGNDQCSSAKLSDVLNLNQLLKANTKKFKMATIQYMSKNNEQLKKELTTMAASVQKPNEGDLGRWIPAKASNILEKLESVTSWFVFEKPESINSSIREKEESLIKSKRFVMFTISVNDEIL